MKLATSLIIASLFPLMSIVLLGCQSVSTATETGAGCRPVALPTRELSLPAVSQAFRQAVLTMPPTQRYREKPAYWPSERLDTANVISSVASQFNFEPLWLAYNGVQIGYVGNDYYRLRLHFDFALRDCADPTRYWVRGECAMDSQQVKFQGYFKLTHARQRQYSSTHNKLPCSNQLFTRRGLVLGEYYLAQYPSGTHPVTLRGVFLTNWLADEHGRLRYDDIEWGSCPTDFFNNNSFIGTWNEGAHSRPCHWGDHRVYDQANRLDIGAGFFSPNVEDYPGRGWESMRNCIDISQMAADSVRYLKATVEENSWR